MLKQAAIAAEEQQKSRDDYRDKGGKYGDKRGRQEQPAKQVYLAKSSSTNDPKS